MSEQLKDRFKHHPPTSGPVQEAHSKMRSAAWAHAAAIEETLVDGREKALALTKVEEAMFWANAAIARTQLVKR